MPSSKIEPPVQRDIALLIAGVAIGFGLCGLIFLGLKGGFALLIGALALGAALKMKR